HGEEGADEHSSLFRKFLHVLRQFTLGQRIQDPGAVVLKYPGYVAVTTRKPAQHLLKVALDILLGKA
ncbi:hypothetical protein DRH13_05945, partial [Candidatus Woesebacteria bacterium]